MQAAPATIAALACCRFLTVVRLRDYCPAAEPAMFEEFASALPQLESLTVRFSIGNGRCQIWRITQPPWRLKCAT